MVTATTKVVCPLCRAVNNYEIIKSDYIDTDLHTTYKCGKCGCHYTNIYTLVFLGGRADGVMYDRDGLTTM